MQLVQRKCSKEDETVIARAELEDKVHNAIGYLKNGFSVEHEAHANDLSAAIESLLLNARKVGVDHYDLVQLVDLAAGCQMSARFSYMLLQCLIPRTNVPWLAIMKAVSWLCVGCLHTKLEVTIVKWITAVCDEVDDQEKLHTVYEMLFFILEDSRLCQPIAELLYHLTKVEDVLQHRLKKLMHLKHKMDSPSNLVALLQLYKVLKHNSVILPKDDQKQLSHKRARLDLPRRLSSSEQVTLLCETEDSTAISLEQIRSFEELLHYIGKVQPPTKMSTVFLNQRFHIMVSSYLDKDMKLRLDLWLQHALHEAFLCSPGIYSDEYRNRLLVNLRKFQDLLQIDLPASSRFFTKYLYSWNWQDFQPQVFDLMPQFLVLQFEDFYNFILFPMKKMFWGSPLQVKVCVLKQLIELMRCLIRNGCFKEDYVHTPASFSHESFSDPDDIRTLEAIAGLADFIGTMLYLAADAADNTALLMNLAMKFYKLMTELPVSYKIPILPLIPLTIAHKALLAVDATTISHLCNLMCRYKTAIVALKKIGNVSCNEHTKRSLAQINTINGLLLDISNTLWRNKALLAVNPTAVSFGIPQRTMKNINVIRKQEAFSIYQHIAFIGYALDFQNTVTLKVTTVNPRNLFLCKHEAKDVYLEFLKRHRLSGISEFVTEFISRK